MHNSQTPGFNRRLAIAVFILCQSPIPANFLSGFSQIPFRIVEEDSKKDRIYLCTQTTFKFSYFNDIIKEVSIFGRMPVPQGFHTKQFIIFLVQS